MEVPHPPPISTPHGLRVESRLEFAQALQLLELVRPAENLHAIHVATLID